jgi:hypothetical protein
MTTTQEGKSAGTSLPPNMRFFVEGNVKLQSALSFSQYALPVRPDLRLITIVGEQHELEFKCEDDSLAVSVTEYTLRTLRNNPKAQVLLEIDPGFIPYPGRWPNSVPIKGVLTEAMKDKELLGRIKGYDLRNFWLGADQRELLYHGVKRVITLPGEYVFNSYVKPFFDKQGIGFHLVSGDFDDQGYQFLSVTYTNALASAAEHIRREMNSSWDMYRKQVIITGPGRHKGYRGKVCGEGSRDTLSVKLDIGGRMVQVTRQRLRLLSPEGVPTEKGEKEVRLEIVKHLQNFWKRVTDWYMLRWMFHTSPVDEVLSIMGEKHRVNLAGVFSQLKPLAEQTGREGKCVSLMNTVCTNP